MVGVLALWAMKFNFRFVSKNPFIGELKTQTQKLSEEDWKYFDYRQKNVVGHRDTFTVPIYFDINNRFAKPSKTQLIEHRHTETFRSIISEISNMLNGLGEPWVVKRANIVTLPAGKEIPTHMDTTRLLTVTSRFHIPIFSNKDCTFVVGDETMHIPEGEVWEIDNTGKNHSVCNLGATDRVHLIIDAQH